jgi:hypothetical protein
MIEALLWMAAAAIWTFMCIPACIAMPRAEKRRISRMLDAMPDPAASLYVRQWLPSQDPAQTAARELARRHFANLLELGWPRSLLFATLLAGAVAAVGIGCCELLIGHAPGIGLGTLAALAGAICWIGNDQVERCRRRDYTPADVASHAMRLVISIPMGAALSSVAAENLAVALSFLLGVFPTTTLIKYGQRFVDRSLNLGDTASTTGAFELEKLQGIGRPEAERLAAEGVRSIVQIAYTDPLALALRANMELDFVTDAVSQALLWCYTTDRLEKVQRLGLRGAVEVKNLRDRLPNEDAASCLRDAAVALEISPASMTTIIEEVALDPYSQFVCALWLETDRVA